MGDYSGGHSYAIQYTTDAPHCIRRARTGAGSQAAPSRRRYRGQGEARGVQGAGILRRDHYIASGGAGAAGISEEAQERTGLRLERRRAGG